MRVAIVGDSFAEHYKNTFFESVCTDNNLSVLDCKGFPGQSQYKIYRHFLSVLNSNPDVVMVVHTEYSRLYHPIQSINPNIENLSLNRNSNSEIINAAKLYYQWLYDDEHAKFQYVMIIKEIQNICRDRKIKLIHFPAFENDFIPKEYGLWFLNTSGLVGLSRFDNPTWNHNIPDTRLNHFSLKGHKIMAEQINPHIKKYINSDQDFHIVSLYSDYFNS